MKLKVLCVQCPNCKDIIYSRCHHDFNSCSCQQTGIDGGFEYCRIIYKSNKPNRFYRNIKATKLELFNDWNNRINLFGKILPNSKKQLTSTTESNTLFTNNRSKPNDKDKKYMKNTKRTSTKRTATKRTSTKRTATKRTATKRTATKRTSTKRTATNSSPTTATGNTFSSSPTISSPSTSTVKSNVGDGGL